MDSLTRINQTLNTYIHPQTTSVLSILGLFVISKKALQAFRAISSIVHIKTYDLPQRYGSGSWALITGGAGGLGAAYARQLAAKGFNIIAIDLNEKNLSLTADAIKKQYPDIQVKSIVCDFADSGQPGFYDNLLKDVEELDISILVNNVGIGFDHIPFHEMSEETVRRILTVNTVPMTMLSRKLITTMLKRARRSAIINMSSMGGVYPHPNEAMYTATKSYIDVLSRMMEVYVKDKIDVVSIRPNLISTALTDYSKVTWDCLSPDVVVESVLRTLGKHTYTFGHPRHTISVWLLSNPIYMIYFGNKYMKIVEASKKRVNKD